MLNQISTSVGTQGINAATVSNSLFSTSIFDDLVISDDTKIWIDDPVGVKVFLRKLI